MPAKQSVEVGGRALVLSNTGKVFFPKSGFTKGEVIAFYAAIAETILPHLHRRPLTLKRYPDGVAGEPFYEKNAPSHTPDWVERFAVPRSEGGSPINYVLCNDAATLAWVTNLGDIEKHVLLAQAPDLNRPTSIVFDLDPGEPANILDCCRVALNLRGLFETWNLQSFVKVSGSKGLHLSVPLNTPATYEMTQPFAKTVAQLAQQQWPDEVVFDMAKTLRRGKVLIDWSQNSDFKTTVAVYAMRAKENGPFISMPVTWEEVAKAAKQKKPDSLFFTPAAAIRRIKRLGDLFAPVLTLQQELPKVFTDALAVSPPPKLSSWPRNRGKSAIKDKSLREYAAKRDHTQTPEPAASDAVPKEAAKGKHRFVIQKHEASHLHYDWRLEMQGVLRSWAVPKGPPTKLREARLAMHVEDHPLDYASFEGTIPAGNYGAGTVMVWDQGEYEDITGNPTAAFYAGKMHVVLHGKKLKGEWILVKDRREEDGNRWLLIKAGKDMTPLTAKQDDTSALSRRSMRRIAQDKDSQWQSNRPATASGKKTAAPKGSHQITPPAFVEPMQCLPVTALPAATGWSFELKFDGYRCLAVKKGSKVSLLSRNEKSLNTRFPAVVEALAALTSDFVLDGEIVALDESGKPSFQLLQNTRSAALPVFFYVFDMLNADGESLVGRPYEVRREKLTDFLGESADPLRLSPLLAGKPSELVDSVRELGLEGVIGKRSDSVYEPGERSGAWVKLRTSREQEFVIGGYVPGRYGFDRLLVGVHEGKKLTYVAKVRNGFVPRVREDIFPLLKKLKTATCPFANLPEPQKSSRWGEPLTAEKMEECVWVKPELVCKVAFVEWTDAGRLRHCTFVAMREDKKSSEVVRET